MVRNVSKPTYFGSGHVPNSKLVSGKIEPKYDQNFIEHNF